MSSDQRNIFNDIIDMLKEVSFTFEVDRNIQTELGDGEIAYWFAPAIWSNANPSIVDLYYKYRNKFGLLLPTRKIDFHLWGYLSDEAKKTLLSILKNEICENIKIKEVNVSGE